MTTFNYTITDPVGIHARPAGLLVKEIKSFAGSAVTITKGIQRALYSNEAGWGALMQMGIKCGDTVTVSVDGGDEAAVAAALENFFKANL